MAKFNKTEIVIQFLLQIKSCKRIENGYGTIGYQNDHKTYWPKSNGHIRSGKSKSNSRDITKAIWNEISLYEVINNTRFKKDGITFKLI